MKKVVIVIILIVLSIILQSSAIVDSHWSTKHIPKNSLLDESDFYIGMWKGCLNIQNQEMCEVIPINTLKNSQRIALSLVRTFTILSVLLLLGALICMSVNNKLVSFMLVASILLSIAAAVVWSTDKDLCPSDVKYGRAFYMNIIGYVLAIAGLLVFRGVKNVSDIKSLFAFF
jgi:hypothetical protein